MDLLLERCTYRRGVVSSLFLRFHEEVGRKLLPRQMKFSSFSDFLKGTKKDSFFLPFSTSIEERNAVS